MNQDEVKTGEESSSSKFTDLLLLDLLHPDWKNFFSRYKIDLLGFLFAWLFVAFIFGTVIILARIGA
jgi:hypothetical protein